MDLCEALRLLNSINDDIISINIDVEVTPEITEELPSGVKDDTYDDQTIDDWWTFINNVEIVIEDDLKYHIVDRANSEKGHKLSYYINFFITDEDGNDIQECVINLRISDHRFKSSNSKAQDKYTRQFRDSKYPQSRYRLAHITVNKNTFDNYWSALNEVKRKLIDIKDNL